MTPDLGFNHVYRAPTPGAPTLLLLHGTGGDEHDLVPLADMIAPGAGVLSPRGQVLENGRPRFFRRVAEGVFDLEDLAARTQELGAFVSAAAAHYQVDGRLIALGFSNGANIASSLLLRQPTLLGGAILFRAMVPFEPETKPQIPGTPVLLSNGDRDPLVRREETNRLASLLGDSGARVTLRWQPAGHELTQSDLAAAREWLAGHPLESLPR